MSSKCLYTQKFKDTSSDYMHQNKNHKLINRLFYWNENNRYLFSRTKTLTFLVFIFTFIPLSFSFPIIFPLMFSLLFSGIVFIIGFLIHKFAVFDSSFYDGSFSENLKYFLFYWHDKPNNFRLSKTKIITVVILIIGLISGLQGFVTGKGGAYLVAYLFMSLCFAVPICLLGVIIHTFRAKLNNVNSTVAQYTYNNPVNNTGNYNNSSPKTSVTDKNSYSNRVDYVANAKKLKKDFDEKELKTRKLIETKFSPPQITYDRFIDVVDECSKIFNEQYLIILDLCELSQDDSVKIQNKINSKLKILKSITDKLDDLSSELVINMSKTNDDDINYVLEDMESLISSVNNYND